MIPAITEKHDVLTQMDLSVQQQEILCSLDLSENPSAVSVQEKIAADLAITFTDGAIGAPRDKWKASKYRRIAKQEPHSETIFKTNTLYFLHSWLRAAFTLLNRTLSFADLFGATGIKLLNTFIQVSGFSYAVILLVDLTLILKAVIRPTGAEEKKLSYFNRFTNIINKEGRIKRMLGAAIWVTISLSAIYLTGGLSLFAGIAFHTFANMSNVLCIAVSSVIKWFDLKNHKALAEKINYRIDELKALEKNCWLNIDDNETRFHYYQNRILNSEDKNSREPLAAAGALVEIGQEILEIKSVIAASEREQQRLTFINRMLDARIHFLKRNRAYAVATATIVVLGVSLVLFAPAGAAILLGTAAVLFAGSVIDGFGKKMYQSLKAHFRKKAAAVETTKALQTTAKLHQKLKLTDKPGPDMYSGEAVDSKFVTGLWQTKKAKVAPLNEPASRPAFTMVL